MVAAQIARAIFVLQVIFTVAQAETLLPLNSAVFQWNVTTHVQDYIAQNQRQYDENILDYESQLKNFKNCYEQSLNALSYQNSLIEKKYQQVNEVLDPLELLSVQTKHCVQSYRWEIPDLAKVQSTLSYCVTKASSAMSTVTSSAESTSYSLSRYYSGQLVNGLNECTKKNPNQTHLNYTLCVVNVISAANTYTINNRNTFSTQLDQAKCSADSLIKDASECSFNELYTTIEKIGAATRLINDCIVNLNKTQIAAQAHESRCGNVLELSKDKVSFQKTTIDNPFYGLKKDTKCVVVNFVN